MTNYKILRQRIKNVAEAPNLDDAYAIEGICRLLDTKYPLDKSPTIFMLFGKTEQEILRALEFYDKHLKQTVQNDMTLEQTIQKNPAPLTLSEAVEKAYAIQKEYAFGGIDKKWIEVQLKSYEAIGLIKFKEATEKDNVIIEARKFAAEYVEYDFKNPANTISKMSRIIDRLLNVMKDSK